MEIQQIPATQPMVSTESSPVIATSRVEAATYNYRAVQIVWFITGLVTTLVAIRFVLKLLGASLQSGFVTFMYSLTDLMVSPFQAIFAAPSQSGATLEVSALVAIVIYGLLGLGIGALVKLMTAPKNARSVA
jgi:uncharacterized protein YggT (Ycf19 family)